MFMVCRSFYSLVLATLLWGFSGAGVAQTEKLVWGIVPIPGAFNVRAMTALDNDGLLALVADAGHMVNDAGALVIAAAAS